MDDFFDTVAARWNKVKGYGKAIRNDWAEGRKPRAVGKVVLPLVPVALAVALLVFLWNIRAVIGKITSGILFLWAVIFMCTQGKGQNRPAVKSDAIVMKCAREGLETLLDHLFLVCESLAEQTEIYSPRNYKELACPDMKRCIQIEDGVAVITVQLHYAGEEIDTVRFLERFNRRMAQMLNNGELRGEPSAVFTDIENYTHTAIQAIRCITVKGERTIRLDVIRVTQEAIPLLDKLDRQSGAEQNDRGQLYDDEL